MNIGGKSFEQLVELGVIDEDTYPYARAGMKVFRCAMSFTIRGGIFVFVSGVILQALRSGTLISLTDLIKNRFDATADYATSVAKFANNPLAGYWCTALVVYLLIAAVIWALYGFLATRRWAYHERSVLYSDMAARALYTRFIKQSGIRRRIAEITQRQASNNSSKLDYSTQAQLEAYRALVKMHVAAHLRQDIETGELERRFIVTIDLPREDEALDKTESLIAKLGQALTRSAKGQAMFSDAVIEKDFSQAKFVAVQAADSALSSRQLKRKAKEEKTAAAAVEAPEAYESTFPIELFNDDTAEINAKLVSARKWAESTAGSLDILLTTSKQRAERIAVTTTSAAVAFDYELPFSLDMASLEQLASRVDQLFKTTGSTAEISAGKLRIIIKLPKRLLVGIDNRTIYDEAFGSTLHLTTAK